MTGWRQIASPIYTLTRSEGVLNGSGVVSMQGSSQPSSWRSRHEGVCGKSAF
jgi:hypothetical protein